MYFYKDVRVGITRQTNLTENSLAFFCLVSTIIRLTGTGRLRYRGSRNIVHTTFQHHTKATSFGNCWIICSLIESIMKQFSRHMVQTRPFIRQHSPACNTPGPAALPGHSNWFSGATVLKHDRHLCTKGVNAKILVLRE